MIRVVPIDGSKSEFTFAELEGDEVPDFVLRSAFPPDLYIAANPRPYLLVDLQSVGVEGVEGDVIVVLIDFEANSEAAVSPRGQT